MSRGSLIGAGAAARPPCGLASIHACTRCRSVAVNFLRNRMTLLIHPPNRVDEAYESPPIAGCVGSDTVFDVVAVCGFSSQDTAQSLGADHVLYRRQSVTTTVPTL